jgi:iron uptake system component EfeO
MSRFGRSITLVGALGVAAILAGCGGTAPSAGPVTPVPSGVIAIQASNASGAYVFTPSAITVPAGSVTFSVRNAGSELHEFEILKGDLIVDELEALVPGLTKDVTVTLAAGDYTFVCKLNGHDLAGMKGTITVN